MAFHLRQFAFDVFFQEIGDGFVLQPLGERSTELLGKFWITPDEIVSVRTHDNNIRLNRNGGAKQ